MLSNAPEFRKVSRKVARRDYTLTLSNLEHTPYYVWQRINISTGAQHTVVSVARFASHRTLEHSCYWFGRTSVMGLAIVTTTVIAGREGYTAEDLSSLCRSEGEKVAKEKIVFW